MLKPLGARACQVCKGVIIYSFNILQQTNYTFNQVMILKTKIPAGEGKTAAVVGTVTHDMHEVPKLKVCALCVSSGTQSCILQAGDKILTFEQLSLDFPKGCGTILSGPRKGREVYRARSLIFLPGKSHGRKSLVGYSPWGHKESDATERLSFFSPLQV
uniref:Large ribosomal subunit protein uL15/eL18 domain-containing protein n=1 Tax=Bos indicus x Bos taurus TaxID=30522 RepID=A0A4W2I1L9_BOBOX